MYCIFDYYTLGWAKNSFRYIIVNYCKGNWGTGRQHIIIPSASKDLKKTREGGEWEGEGGKTEIYLGALLSIKRPFQKSTKPLELEFMKLEIWQ